MKEIQIIDLPKIMDERGNLSFLESNNHIPLKVARVYWIYDVPGGAIRGSHAFKDQSEFLIALSGSFDVETNNGTEKKVFSLNRSYYGLYLPKLTWRTLKNFSTNSICLVLSSSTYKDTDYIRNFETFLRIINEKNSL